MGMLAQLAAYQPDVPGPVPSIHTMKSTKGGAIMRYATARASPSRAGTLDINHNIVAGRHGTKTVDKTGWILGIAIGPTGMGDGIALGAW